MVGQVTVWQMTPEELEAYKKKHPIKPQTKRKRSEAFDNIGVDYKWRGDRGAASRWGN